ncbi:MAG: SusD/RagB family nutrient-binding outer membrane lipoprotein [Cyclobacteriaceae bacterium]|nr:SusD/RagB family nutrient-binding outer membrane lipoprotein [Cyclobacteriaceae bacterium]
MIYGNYADPSAPEADELATQKTNWIRFGNSIHLKLLMRQSIADPSVSSAVIDLVNSQNGLFIEDESQLARIRFQGETGQNWNPMYARREQGVGQFYIASNSAITKMTELSDPRLSVIYNVADKTGTIVGIDQGDIVNRQELAAGDVSFPSSVAYGPANDVILTSHWEVMFLRAEADMRFGTNDDETEMFNAAVTAHFDYIGATLGNYLSTEVVYNAGESTEAKSNLIGIQKWISFNGLQESEGWIEARRFNTSSSPIFTGGATPILIPHQDHNWQMAYFQLDICIHKQSLISIRIMFLL